MEEKIVFQGKSKSGKGIIIRYPRFSDAQLLTDYINNLSDERTFITYQGEHETLESETQYLLNQLDKINNKKLVQLVVLCEDKIIGNSEISMGTKTGRHIGLLGISISGHFRNDGVGKLLMENLIQEAINNLIELEIITLGVFSNNKKAIEWYKKLGFIEEGRIPNGIKLENGYQDHIFMYKKIK